MGGGPTGPLLQHTRLHQQTEIGISVTNVCPGWAGASSKAGPCREPKLAARGMLFLSLAPSWHCQPICKPSPTSSTYKSTSLSQRAAIRPKDNGDKRRDKHQMCACHSDTRCIPLSPPLSHQVCHQPCHCLTNPRSRSGCIINTLCIATLTHNVHLSAV